MSSTYCAHTICQIPYWNCQIHQMPSLTHCSSESFALFTFKDDLGARCPAAQHDGRAVAAARSGASEPVRFRREAVAAASQHLRDSDEEHNHGAAGSCAIQHAGRWPGSALCKCHSNANLQFMHAKQQEG